mmetsp:Transcript_33787/g.54233  ORF Transcript_33787/g.54233 Transcript_33787/m.54233 type:complete len:238 (+) Transcript_33787:590-1303(+)
MWPTTLLALAYVLATQLPHAGASSITQVGCSSRSAFKITDFQATWFFATPYEILIYGADSGERTLHGRYTNSTRLHKYLNTYAHTIGASLGYDSSNAQVYLSVTSPNVLIQEQEVSKFNVTLGADLETSWSQTSFSFKHSESFYMLAASKSYLYYIDNHVKNGDYDRRNKITRIDGLTGNQATAKTYNVQGGFQITGLAVDPVTDIVYYCDHNDNTIVAITDFTRGKSNDFFSKTNV